MPEIIIDRIIESVIEANQEEAGADSVFPSEPANTSDPFFEYTLAEALGVENVYHH